MVPYKALYDNHTGCLSFGQVWASMSLWDFGYKICNIKVRTICEGLVTAKGYLRIVKTFQVNSGVEIVILKVFLCMM